MYDNPANVREFQLGYQTETGHEATYAPNLHHMDSSGRREKSRTTIWLFALNALRLTQEVRPEFVGKPKHENPGER
jgi:hypothetical protein